ncbi:unnamed protein product [Gongylonema pulchrum]|uniref:Bridge-like lipid transfer protein family member 1 C-terminal domain-containing protein n=1 Tax=Gongylonema pulchrum TaxID=637853 RepID=A0A183D058_9BILA|nr:unnamed protein product [Gongylonema pulchrum]
MDLLLQLPSLKLVAIARHGNISSDLDVSLSLRSFSICLYNPHQPSPVDAFALTLDKLIIGVSRSAILLRGSTNVKITGAISIGLATFSYDMRRLSELIAFPRPWYRRAIARRLLLGRTQQSSLNASDYHGYF